MLLSISENRNSSKLSSTLKVRLMRLLCPSVLHLKCPLLPHSMQRFDLMTSGSTTFEYLDSLRDPLFDPIRKIKSCKSDTDILIEIAIKKVIRNKKVNQEEICLMHNRTYLRLTGRSPEPK